MYNFDNLKSSENDYTLTICNFDNDKFDEIAFHLMLRINDNRLVYQYVTIRDDYRKEILQLLYRFKIKSLTLNVVLDKEILKYNTSFDFLKSKLKPNFLISNFSKLVKQ